MNPVTFCRNNISAKLFLGCFTASLVPLVLLTFILYYIYSGVMEEKTIAYSHKLLRMGTIGVEDYIRRLDQISFTVYQDNIQQALNDNTDKSKIRYISNIIEFEEAFQRRISLLNFEGEIAGITIIPREGKAYYFGKGILYDKYSFSSQGWYASLTSGQVDKMLVGPHFQPYIKGEAGRRNPTENRMENACLSHIRIIDSMHTGVKYLGIVIIDFEYKDLDSILGQLKVDEDSEIFVLDQNGETVYEKGVQTTDFEENGEIIKQIAGTASGHFIKEVGGKRMLVSYYSISGTPWYVICVNNFAKLLSDTKRIGNIAFLVFSLSVIIAGLISTLLSVKLVKSLKNLGTAMEKVRNGDMSIQVIPASKDEIGQLSVDFNNMIGTIRSLIDEVYKVRLRQREAQFNSLQSQINPHFLYNTLETISSMAQVEGIEKISDISLAMSEMFRYSTKYGDMEVKVWDEIKHTANYLNIIHVRFEDRFEAELHIPEELMHLKILKFVIQPVVENSVRHGIEPKKGRGRISVRALVRNNRMELRISDNGKGIEAVKLEEIRALLGQNLGENDAGQKKGSIGLKNVHDRIRLHYGDAYGLDIQSTSGEGTEVTLAFPVQPFNS